MREVHYSGQTIQVQRHEDLLPFLAAAGFTDVADEGEYALRADGTRVFFDGPGGIRVCAERQEGLDAFERTYDSYRRGFTPGGSAFPSSG